MIKSTTPQNNLLNGSLALATLHACLQVHVHDGSLILDYAILVYISSHDSPLVPGMDVSTLLYEELNSGRSVKPSGKVEGGGVPPTHVTTVHIVRIA